MLTIMRMRNCAYTRRAMHAGHVFCVTEYHNNIQFPHGCTIYVGLTQARPNYCLCMKFTKIVFISQLVVVYGKI